MKIRDYEGRIALLTQEIERLNSMMRGKSDEIEQWKVRCSKYEISISEYRSYDNKLKDYENRIALLSQEIERLNSMLKTRSQDIEYWKTKYSQLEYSIYQYRDYEERVKILTL